MIPAKEFKQMIRLIGLYITRRYTGVPFIKRSVALRNVNGQWQIEAFNDYARVFYQTGLEALLEGVFPFEPLRQLAQGLPSHDTITFRAAQGDLVFETQHMTGLIKAVGRIDDYLSLPGEWLADAAIEVPLQGLGVAAAHDEGRPVLNNIAFLCGQQMVCAADGFRLHARHYDEGRWTGLPREFGFHYRAFPFPVDRLEVMDKSVRVTGPNWYVLAPLETLNFPDISKIMPSTKGLIPIYVEDPLAEAKIIGQAIPLAPKSNMAKLSEHGLLFGEEEQRVIRVRGDLKAPPGMFISLNLRYIVDALRFLSGPTTVYLSNEYTPLRLESLKRTALIMPMHSRLDLDEWLNILTPNSSKGS